MQQLKENAKLKMNFEAAELLLKALDKSKASVGGSISAELLEELLEASRDIIAPVLDSKYGSTVTDHKLFRDLSSFWEADFMGDMETLNVHKPDALTRVSEYVPQIVDYIKVIIDNGYA